MKAELLHHFDSSARQHNTVEFLGMFVSHVKKFAISSTLRPKLFAGKYSKAAIAHKIRHEHKIYIYKKKSVSVRAYYRLMLRPACQTGLR